MNFLFLGDIVGRAGRNIVIEKLSQLIKQFEKLEVSVSTSDVFTFIKQFLN